MCPQSQQVLPILHPHPPAPPLRLAAGPQPSSSTRHQAQCLPLLAELFTNGELRDGLSCLLLPG